MKYALHKFKDNELEWLDNRIDAINVQFRCPKQCIICGAGTQRTQGKNSMDWETLSRISDTILEVKEKKDIDILLYNPGTAIDLFRSSDPPFYKSMHNNEEKTIYDVIKKMNDEHGKTVRITTSGWRPGNNHMQRAVDKILSDESMTISEFNYSIKTVSLDVMADYDNFLKNTHRAHGSGPQSLQEFIENSRYAAQLIENMKCLKVLGSKAEYELQYISDQDLDSPIMKSNYGKYSEIFTKKFLIQLGRYAANKAGMPKSHKYAATAFEGAGNALELGMPMHPLVEKNIKHIDGHQESSIDRYNAIISPEGRIQIFYGNPNSFTRVYAPKEHFIRIADNMKDKKKHDHYMMLAGLQNKSMLN